MGDPGLGEAFAPVGSSSRSFLTYASSNVELEPGSQDMVLEKFGKTFGSRLMSSFWPRMLARLMAWVMVV